MSKEKIKALRGMNDILPSDSPKWQKLERTITSLMALYGFENIRTPIMEETKLFARGIGDVTDIVEKEMYSFSMKPNPTIDDMMTLRPEFTAGIVRAVIEHNLVYDRPQKLFSFGPVFRHERPQKGRYRQFHQLSVEALGFTGPDIDAELIALLNRLWQTLGLTDIRLELNSLGNIQERLAHRQVLIEYLEKYKDSLDEDGLRRMYTNPLRVLDTKNPTMQDMANAAPKLFDFLGTESRQHYDELCERLDQIGIPYTLNTRLVRGLDYYNLTVFEWVTDKLGAQGTVCGGGRYDGLVEMLGGKPTPAVGFGLGIERLLELMELNESSEKTVTCDIYVIHQGKQASLKAFEIGELCRSHGYHTQVHAGSTGFKSQFKRADNSGATLALILGDNEIETGTIGIKALRNSELNQQNIPQSELINQLKRML
ncbi:histidine--tRNA ligase [Basilea psittacipulmonis]|uniref:Histidine--tRNA ligase n=1 Tax=Basilea psittacipulmonis DSM 24701 TaxID=1072685 RepID=A0A077DHP6_9BURK|nr:histidine--tRNA ligase [Basilea psittacipulmonis]AIL32663.1 histidine--tRNA ligase [Basilea psittacipulmonis DSM 24701]